MKKLRFLLLFFCFLDATAQKTTLKTFDFLIGSWETTGNKKISEHWKRNGNMLNGASYKHTASGDSVLTETVIVSKKSGDWYYSVTGYEKGNTGTTDFKLVTVSDNTYMFENPVHDFPNRIVYQLKDKNRIHAWIAGKMNGKDVKIEFLYVRKR